MGQSDPLANIQSILKIGQLKKHGLSPLVRTVASILSARAELNGWPIRSPIHEPRGMAYIKMTIVRMWHDNAP